MKSLWGLVLLSFLIWNTTSTPANNSSAGNTTCSGECMISWNNGTDMDGGATNNSNNTNSTSECICSSSIIMNTTNTSTASFSLTMNTMATTTTASINTDATRSVVMNSTVTIASFSSPIPTAITNTTAITTDTISITNSTATSTPTIITTSVIAVNTTTTTTTTTTITMTTATPGAGDTGKSGSSNTGAIAAGLSLGLGLPIIILTVIAIIVCYKLYVINPGRKRIKRRYDSRQLLDDDHNYNGSAVLDSNVKSETTKETSFINSRPSFPPIALEDLPKVVSDLHEDDDVGFTSEYKFIQQSSPAFAQTHAYTSTNMEKNRYRNILPFDDTRVLLKAGGTSVTDNYINANYIDGYSGSHTYIAAQGPLPNTLSDFWQMIWEHKSQIIVMLTGLVEGGKRKCTQYWPEPQDGVLEYGNIEVKLVTENHYSFYTHRTMEISQKHSTANTTMKSDERTIQHFAFTQWPDFGVPTNPQSMLRFTRIVRSKIPPHHNSPMIVHCSAGVGRSGTFIAMDVMLQRMAKQQALNIKEFVLGMRYQRNNMVQTERQYVFLYDALLEAYLYGDTAVEAKSLKRHVWSLTQEIQGTGVTEIAEEFNHLPSCDYSEETFTVALSEGNIRKNRDKSYIPFDFSRIVVGDEGRYINAAPVKGYNESTEFIATQHPLVNTISDFWTMVCERNVKVIVMLGGLKNMKDSYWNTTRHPVVITKEESTQYYIKTHVTIQEPKEHSVIHYTFKAWVPEKVVPTRKSILSLIKEVNSVNDPGRPIIVHSSTSMSNEGSGMYCALKVCLDSLNNEGYVDVFQTVRSLREQRPYILYSMELYKFIYLCLVEFLQSHQDS